MASGTGVGEVERWWEWEVERAGVDSSSVGGEWEWEWPPWECPCSEGGEERSVVARCGGGRKELPWKRNRPKMLLAKPKLPTMITNLGFETSILLVSQSVPLYILPCNEYKNSPVMLKNLSIASMKILKHRANRNTPLIKAPKISALCHPYEFSDDLVIRPLCSE